jgi:hypothetical protein
MSWVATAVVGGAVIGGVMSNNAADKAASAQRDAVNTQSDLAREQFTEQNRLAEVAAGETRTALTPFLDQLAKSADASRQAALSGATDIANASTTANNIANSVGQHGINTATAYSDALLFQMQGEFTRWNQIYGPIQDNLAHFYQQLTPESLIATGLDASQQAFQTSLKTIQRNFAQRGLDTGAEALLDQQATLANATERAKLRYEAPFKVADAQQSFLTSTSSIQNPYVQAVQNTVNNRQQLALTNGQFQASIAQQQAAIANAATNARTAAEQNYQNSLAEAAGLKYQAERDIAETKGNVASRSQTDLTRTMQEAAAARGQITANQANAQANAIGNVVNTGVGIYAMKAAHDAAQANAIASNTAPGIGIDTPINTELNYSIGG